MPEFPETVEHARAGYANAQDVIKFIDTKSGVVTGLITVMLGLPFVVIQWLAEQGDDAMLSLRRISEQSPVWSCASLVVLVLGLFSGLIALWSALHGLLPRSPAGRAAVTVLFPMFDPQKGKARARRSLARLPRGLSHKQILREYQHQLFRVGQILHEKTALLHKTGNFFKLQIALYVVSLFLLLMAKVRP